MELSEIPMDTSASSPAKNPDTASFVSLISTFAHLPPAETLKVKKMYLYNTITDFKSWEKQNRIMLVVFCILSIIPLFLLVTIPCFIAYKTDGKARKQKIL